MSPCPLRLFVTENMMSMLSPWCWASPAPHLLATWERRGKKTVGLQTPEAGFAVIGGPGIVHRRTLACISCFMRCPMTLLEKWAQVSADEPWSEWVSMGVSGWAWVWIGEPGCEWMSLGVSGWAWVWAQLWVGESRCGHVSSGTGGWAQVWVDEHRGEWVNLSVSGHNVKFSLNLAACLKLKGRGKRRSGEEGWKLNLCWTCPFPVHLIWICYWTLEKKKNHHWDLSGLTECKLVLLPSGFS